jgi:hypothetical protein
LFSPVYDLLLQYCLAKKIVYGRKPGSGIRNSYNIDFMLNSPFVKERASIGLTHYPFCYLFIFGIQSRNMKVYYNTPDKNLIEEGFKNLEPRHAEGLKLVEPFIKLAVESRYMYMIQKCEAMKYKIMWELRDIEKEIDAEPEGIIIVGENSDVKGFSDELFQKIAQRLKKIKR